MISKEVADKIKSGAKVIVWEKFKEGDKERIIRFEGLVLARKHGNEMGANFTVRGSAAGVAIEKIFPIHSPTIEKVEIIKKAKVRRAKLYYLRGKSRKEIRKKIRAV